MEPRGSILTNRPTAGSGLRGVPPDSIWDAVERAWSLPFSVSSNYARENALAVATAASLGWISNITLDGKDLTRRWHITVAGTAALQSREKLSK